MHQDSLQDSGEKAFAMGLKAGRSWLESLQLILVLPQWLTRILGCRESI